MAQLRIGDKLLGYCGGAFGRDSYADKRVEAIGSDWIVVRELNDSARPDFAWGEDIDGELAPYCERLGARYDEDGNVEEAKL